MYFSTHGKSGISNHKHLLNNTDFEWWVICSRKILGEEGRQEKGSDEVVVRWWGFAGGEPVGDILS